MTTRGETTGGRSECSRGSSPVVAGMKEKQSHDSWTPLDVSRRGRAVQLTAEL
jgi:hypothetical protein